MRGDVDVGKAPVRVAPLVGGNGGGANNRAGEPDRQPEIGTQVGRPGAIPAAVARKSVICVPRLKRRCGIPTETVISAM